jgi:hypothetical protein
MFVLMSLMFPLLYNEPFSAQRIGIEFVVCMTGGLLFGLFMKWFMNRRGKAEDTPSLSSE